MKRRSVAGPRAIRRRGRRGVEMRRRSLINDLVAASGGASALHQPPAQPARRCENPLEFAWGSWEGMLCTGIGMRGVELLSLVWNILPQAREKSPINFAYSEGERCRRVDAYKRYPRSSVTILDCGEISLRQAISHIYMDDLNGLTRGIYIFISVSREDVSHLKKVYRGSGFIICLTSDQLEVIEDLAEVPVQIQERKMLVAWALKPLMEGLHTLVNDDGCGFVEFREHCEGKVGSLGSCLHRAEPYEDIAAAALKVAGLWVDPLAGTAVAAAFVGGHYQDSAGAIDVHRCVHTHLEKILGGEQLLLTSTFLLDEDPGVRWVTVVVA